MTVSVCVMNEKIARDLLDWEDFPNCEDYEQIVEGEIISKGRWMTYYRDIYQHKPSGTYWAINYERGNTEYQDSDDDEISFYEVKPKEKTIIVYVSAN